MRIIGVYVCIAALALAGCATQGALTGAAARPKTVIVTDFVASSDVSAIDRGYSTRLERKGGDFPILERNKRTMARVNDEIVASIVASLREAGLDARPGSDEGLTYGDDALLIKGGLRASDKLKPAQMKQVGFGGGRGFVVADMTVSRFTSARREQLFTFAADASGKRKARHRQGGGGKECRDRRGVGGARHAAGKAVFRCGGAGAQARRRHRRQGRQLRQGKRLDGQARERGAAAGGRAAQCRAACAAAGPAAQFFELRATVHVTRVVFVHQSGDAVFLAFQRRGLRRTPHTTKAITGNHGTTNARDATKDAIDVTSVYPIPLIARVIGARSRPPTSAWPL